MCVCVCARALHVFCIEACSHSEHEEALRARVTSSVSEHQTCQKPSVLSSLFPRKRQRKTCKPQDPTPVTINGGCQPLLTSRDARSDRLSSGADVPRPRSLSLVCTQHPSPQETRHGPLVGYSGPETRESSNKNTLTLNGGRETKAGVRLIVSNSLHLREDGGHVV